MRAKIQGQRYKGGVMCALYLVSCILYLTLLSACGFHLRGSVTERVQLPPTFLAGQAGPLQQELRHYLSLSEAPVVAEQRTRNW